MISLYYVEKLLDQADTELVNRPCAAKKLRVTFIASNQSSTPAQVIFRDGSNDGPIRARLTVQDGAPVDTIECNENECISFATSMYVDVSGTAAVGAYLMGNPVGSQGS